MPYSNTQMWQSTIPNKFVEYTSEGLFLFTSLNKGLANSLIKTNDLGSIYMEGDTDDFVKKLENININTLRNLKKDRKRFFDNNFSQSATIDRLKNLLKNLNE